MDPVKASNSFDYNYNISNINNTFSNQNKILGDSFSLPIDENNRFNSFSDIEPISDFENISSINNSNIYQSTKEFLDTSFNGLNFSSIGYNHFLPDNIISSPKINNSQKTMLNNYIKNKNIPLFIIKKRKRNINTNSAKKSERRYDKFNISNKIQGFYSNLLIDCQKSVCESIGREDLIFKKIIREYKVDNTFIKSGNKTIEDFFKNASESNENICKKIEEEKIPELIDILKKNYLFFFKTIFFAERKEKYKLKEFGLADIEIKISNTTKLFNDITEDKKDDKKYVKLLRGVARKNFFPKGENIYFNCRKLKKLKNN